MAGKSSGCLIENNIVYRTHGGIMMNWGASGNVVGYNYCVDPFDSGATNVMMYALSDNHGAHPMFNLFEGNITGSFHPDSYWGSSSHGTVLRNWMTGDTSIQPPYDARGTLQTGHHSNQGLRAIALDFAQSNYNIVGNVVGSPYGADHDVRQAVAPATRTYQSTLYLYSFGYSDVSDAGGDSNDNARPYTTGIFHGNYDYVTAGQVWDSTITDHTLPNSYYLAGKPAWFGNLAWPAINPASPPANVDVIPAGYRFLNNVNPPSSSDVAPSNAKTAISTQ